MKMKTVWGLLLLPFFASGQTVDTTLIIKRVDSLIQVSRALTGTRDFEQALTVNAAAEKLVTEKLGLETAAYGSTCFNHGRVLHLRGDLVEAEKWYLIAKAVRERVLPKAHIDYINSLNNLAMVYKLTNRYELAEQTFLEAITIQKNALRELDPDRARLIISLADFYYLKNQYSQAEARFSEAIHILDKAPAHENPLYTYAMVRLATMYADARDFEQSEHWYLAARAEYEQAGTQLSANYAACLNGLGYLYQKMGDLEKAEVYGLEARNILEKTLGKNSIDYTNSLSVLGFIYQEKGDYERAVDFLTEAMVIRRQLVGKDHLDYGTSVMTLANTYKEEGLYDKARSLYQEAKAIQEKWQEKESADYANILNNLATLSYYQQKFDDALALYQEALDIFAKVVGKEHPDYAGCLDNLANVYQDQGAYQQALPLRLEARAIWEKTLGKENIHYTATLINLGNLYRLQGAYDQALPYYLEASDIRKKIFGPEHFAYVSSLNNLALLYAVQGDSTRAIPLFLAANTRSRSLIQKSATFSSEKEMVQIQALFAQPFDDLFHFAQLYRSNALAMAAYDNALFLHHALLFKAIARDKEIALADSTTRTAYAELKSCRSQLARQYVSPLAERDSARMADLEEQANQLEKELVRRSKNFAASQREVDWQEVQRALKPTEAAIEFVHYKFHKPGTIDISTYAALLLRPDNAPPRCIPLFEEKELLPLLHGANGGSNFLKINALYSSQKAGGPQKSLYELLWQPLEKQLQGITTLYCSPSGLLHRLNLAAIPDGNGKIFGDQHQIVLLGSTRQLVVPNAVAQNATNTAYLVGGVRYDTDSSAIALANHTIAARSFDVSDAPEFQLDTVGNIRRSGLDYLPSTATEVDEIGRMLQANKINTQVDTGFYATEEAFRRLGVGAPSPRVIHLATHGYFFPDPQAGNTGGGTGEESVFKISEHPMIRSGLMLAGAKRAWLTGKHPQNQEDGVLTAYEISQMNLRNTELVVLSACETGLGDIEGNEGVYGLQRAFKIAGAKYLIMSLWKVDDRSTKDFMIAFYGQWLIRKLPIPQAFRAAQQAMRSKHPSAYDWAGFILIE